jgi:ketosteroid isomerase-like protein
VANLEMGLCPVTGPCIMVHMAQNQNRKQGRKLPRDEAYLASIRGGRVLRAATFTNRKREASRRACRGKVRI